MSTLLKKCLAAALMFGSLLSIGALTPASAAAPSDRSEEHTSELQSP